MNNEIMTLLSSIQPNWSYTSNGFTRNGGVELLREVEQKVAELLTVEAQSRAGARMGELAKLYPFVAKATLNFSVSGDYDDQGGTFTCVNVSFSDVEVNAAMPLPLNFSDGDELDEDALRYAMADELSEEGDLSGFYLAAGKDVDDYEDLEVVVDFSRINELLGDAEISGIAAYKKLFPGNSFKI